MRNKAALLLVLIFACTHLGAARPIYKLGRGVEGILTAPIEYFNEYLIASEKKSQITAVVAGVFGGTAMTVKRLINGVYDIVTFPLPYPKPYRILWRDDAETALQDYYQLQNNFYSTNQGEAKPDRG